MGMEDRKREGSDGKREEKGGNFPGLPLERGGGKKLSSLQTWERGFIQLNFAPGELVRKVTLLGQ